MWASGKGQAVCHFPCEDTWQGNQKEEVAAGWRLPPGRGLEGQLMGICCGLLPNLGVGHLFYAWVFNFFPLRLNFSLAY